MQRIPPGPNYCDTAIYNANPDPNSNLNPEEPTPNPNPKVRLGPNLNSKARLAPNLNPKVIEAFPEWRIPSHFLPFIPIHTSQLTLQPCWDAA